MSALLEISDLRARHPGGGLLRGRRADAVAGVSLNVRAGETFALVGESGSGKTSLIRAVAGLVPIVGGSVCFEGRELRGLSSSEWRPIRRRMAMMFQDPSGSLSPRLKVWTLVAEPLRIHGVENARAEAFRLLALTGLGAEFADRYPHQLSGGQARRVGAARALALNPKLLLADEPTAGLDVSVQGGILNLLGKLQKQFGLALLLVTHNLHIARHVSDRVAVMYLGKLAETAPAGRIFSEPLHPYTRALLSSAAVPADGSARKTIRLKGEIPGADNPPSGCRFHTRCPRAADRCRTEPPAWREWESDHWVACHFAGESDETPPL